MKQRHSLLSRLTNNHQNFSKSHKALARFVLTNYQKVAFTTIKQLAELTGISQATIVRFARVLGFSGYPAFQKEIRRIVRADLKGSERFRMADAYRERDSGPLRNILEKEIENLSYLQENFDEKEFRQVVAAIKEASEILVIGTRSAASLAHHLWFYLKKLEIKATRVISITTETYEYISKLDGQSVIIVIGFPRYLKELLDILDFAKDKGIKTVTITDSPLSPLIGDLTLYSPAESTSFVAFHCAPTALINAIIYESSLTDQKHTLAALNRFEQLAETCKIFARH